MGPGAVAITGWACIGLIGAIVLGLDIWAVWFTPAAGTSLGFRLSIAAFVLLITAPIGAAVVGNWCGRTTITPDGLTVRTLLRRRHVPWSWIESFEISDIGSRGSTMYALWANHSPRRFVTCAGVVTFKMDNPEFQARVAEVQAAWTAATGRTAQTPAAQ